MENNTAKQRITIVTVLHNSAAVIAECLKSIPKGVIVYVVDNASSDNGIEIAKSARPDATIIKSEKNLGFGRGNNLGLEKVKTEYALVLNPDTLMQADTLDNLLKVADRYDDAAIISPTIYSTNGSVQKTYKNSIFAKDNSFNNYISAEGDACAEWLTGAAMLLKMDIFRKIGFFDPKIFLFFEDDDICLNARKSGYSLITTPESKLIHLCGRSSPATYKYMYRKNWHTMWSRLYLEKKYNGNTPAMNLAKKELLIHFKKVIISLLLLKKQKFVCYLAQLRAAIAFMRGRDAF